MDRKRLLFLVLFIAIAAGIGYGIYALFFRKPAEPIVTPPPEQTEQPGGGLLPSAGTGTGGTAVAPPRPLPPGVSLVAQGGVTAVTPVANTPTVGATLSAAGTVSYYDRLDGKFYRLQPDGTAVSLSNKAFRNLTGATFDPKGEKAVLEFPDGANVLFDFSSAQQVTLPKHWEEFSFSPAGDKIAAKSIGIDEANRFLVIANPDGSGAKAVQELGPNAAKVNVDWSPNGQVLATAATGQSFGVDRKEIFFVGQNNENFRSMVVEGLNFQPKWTPSGSRLLYSVAGSLSDYKPQLWIVDAVGDSIGRNRKSLSVNTWAEKCSFGSSDSTLFCAVPNTLPRGAGLQPAVADRTPDTIYKIDLTTGLQTRVAVPEGSHTIERMMVSADGKYLFFTDKGSGILNRIQLTP